MHSDLEVTSFLDRPVYDNKGQFVGVVNNVVLNLPERRIGKLVLTRTNHKIIEAGSDIAIPYRWVSAVNDIILLSTFPKYVHLPVEEEVEA